MKRLASSSTPLPRSTAEHSGDVVIPREVCPVSNGMLSHLLPFEHWAHTYCMAHCSYAYQCRVKAAAFARPCVHHPACVKAACGPGPCVRCERCMEYAAMQDGGQQLTSMPKAGCELV
eukprot:366228-Chlamydomonas_euryale.AAC.21